MEKRIELTCGGDGRSFPSVILHVVVHLLEHERTSPNIVGHQGKALSRRVPFWSDHFPFAGRGCLNGLDNGERRGKQTSDEQEERRKRPGPHAITKTRWSPSALGHCLIDVAAVEHIRCHRYAVPLWKESSAPGAACDGPFQEDHLVIRRVQCQYTFRRLLLPLPQ